MDGVVRRNCAGENRRRELARERQLWESCGNQETGVEDRGKYCKSYETGLVFELSPSLERAVAGESRKLASTLPLSEIIWRLSMSEHFGVYIRQRDMWHLENVAYREAAELSKQVNEGFGLETLIEGPWTILPEWLES